MKPADLATVCLLGLGLAAAGWRDWQTLGHDRQHTYPGIDLLRESLGVRRVGGAEIFFRDGHFLAVDGIADVENLGHGPFRHGLGPATRLVLRSDTAREAVVAVAFYSGIGHQDLVFRHDGQPLEELRDQPKDVIRRTFTVPLGPGEHVFQLEYARWNHHGDDSAPGDGRTMAGTFDRLQVEFR